MDNTQQQQLGEELSLSYDPNNMLETLAPAQTLENELNMSESSEVSESLVTQLDNNLEGTQQRTLPVIRQAPRKDMREETSSEEEESEDEKENENESKEEKRKRKLEQNKASRAKQNATRKELFEQLRKDLNLDTKGEINTLAAVAKWVHKKTKAERKAARRAAREAEEE